MSVQSLKNPTGNIGVTVFPTFLSFEDVSGLMIVSSVNYLSYKIQNFFKQSNSSIFSTISKSSEKLCFERFLFCLFHATVKAFEINQRSSLWKSRKNI